MNDTLSRIRSTSTSVAADHGLYERALTGEREAIVAFINALIESVAPALPAICNPSPDSKGERYLELISQEAFPRSLIVFEDGVLAVCDDADEAIAGDELLEVVTAERVAEIFRFKQLKQMVHALEEALYAQTGGGKQKRTQKIHQRTQAIRALINLIR